MQTGNRYKSPGCMYYILIVVYDQEGLEKPPILVISYSTSIVTFPCQICKCIKRNFITVI